MTEKQESMVINIEKDSGRVIKIDPIEHIITVTQEKIAELKAKFGNPEPVESNIDLVLSRKNRTVVRTIRTTVEKQIKEGNKELRELARKRKEYGESITGGLLEIEAAQKEVESKYEAKVKAEKEEAARIEAERVGEIRTKISEIILYPARFMSLTPKEIDQGISDLSALESFDFQEFKGEGAQALDAAKIALQKLFLDAQAREQAERDAEAERERIERKEAELEAERQRIAAEDALKKQEAERIAAEERERLAEEKRKQDEELRLQREEQERKEAELEAERKALEEEKSRIAAEEQKKTEPKSEPETPTLDDLSEDDCTGDLMECDPMFNCSEPAIHSGESVFLSDSESKLEIVGGGEWCVNEMECSCLPDERESCEITIPKCQFDKLIADQRKLRALESAGVDKWDGYDLAMEGIDE